MSAHTLPSNVMGKVCIAFSSFSPPRLTYRLYDALCVQTEGVQQLYRGPLARERRADASQYQLFRARALLQQQRAQPFAHRAGAELILRGHYALYAVQRPANTVAVQRRDPVQLYHPGGNALPRQQRRCPQRLLRQDTVGHDSRVCPLTEHRH